jgi:hypothetical protein
MIRMYALAYLGMAFFLIAFGFIGNFLLQWSSLFEEACVSTGFILSVLFTNSTFHKDKKNNKITILFLIIILALTHYYLVALKLIEKNMIIYFVEKVLDIIFTFITFNWTGFSAYLAYKRLKDKEINSWIKIRYRIFSYSAMILSVQAIPELMIIGYSYGDTELSIIVFGITTCLVLIVSIGNVLAWIIPSWLKKRYHKESRELKYELLPEEELIRRIKEQMKVTQKSE